MTSPGLGRLTRLKAMGARSPVVQMFLAALLVGCGGGKSSADAAPGAAASGDAPSSVCPGAYERITADDAGHELAVSYRDIDRCIGGRCCGPDGPQRPNTPTMADRSCCSGVRYQVNSTERTCAPAP